MSAMYNMRTVQTMIDKKQAMRQEVIDKADMLEKALLATYGRGTPSRSSRFKNANRDEREKAYDATVTLIDDVYDTVSRFTESYEYLDDSVLTGAVLFVITSHYASREIGAYDYLIPERLAETVSETVDSQADADA